MTREIILMRHGQPHLAGIGKVSPRGMQRWIADYEQSAITDLPPPQASAALAARARVIVSSSAPRALTSVAALGLEPDRVDGMFCEAQLPYGRWPLPRLSPFTWAFVLRMLWLCGAHGQVESARKATARAQAAARQLQSLADNGSVLLLGHGFMNRMIARHLKAGGWERHSSSGSGYWSAAVYRMEAERSH